MSGSEHVSDLYSELSDELGNRLTEEISVRRDSRRTGKQPQSSMPSRDPPLGNFTAIKQDPEVSAVLKLPCHNLDKLRNESLKPTFGRQTVLNTIEGFFQARYRTGLQAFVLYGGEGMGKTHLARLYAMRKKQDFDVVFWIDASTESSIFAGFRTFASQLRLPVANSTLPEPDTVIQNAVKVWLSNPLSGGEKVSWLLILDAANDLNIVSEIWPHGGEGCLLLTTRQPAIQATFETESLHLEPLPITDAASMLMSLTETTNNPDSSSHARSIADFWEGIPICMELVSSLVKSGSLSLLEFETNQAKMRSNYLLRKSSDDMASSTGIFNALSQQLVKAQGKSDLALLLVLSFLEGSGVHEHLLKYYSPDSALKDYPKDEESYKEARTRLWQSSVITYDSDSKTIRILRTIQDATLGEFYSDDLELVLNGFVLASSMILSAWPCSITVEESFSQINIKHRWQICALLIPHVHRLWNRYLDLRVPERRKVSTKTFTALLTEAAWYETETANIKESQDLIERGFIAYNNAEFTERNSMVKVLSALYNTRAAIFSRLGKHKESLDDMEHYLGVQEMINNVSRAKMNAYVDIKEGIQAVFGDNESLKLASAYSEVAMARLECRHRGWPLKEASLEEIPTILEISATIRKNHKGFKAVDLYNVLRYKGLYHLSQGKWAEAEKCFEQMMKDRATEYGTDDIRGPRCGIALVSMGDIYSLRTVEMKAYDLYKRGHTSLKSAVGSTHLTTLRAEYKLARCLLRLGTKQNLEDSRNLLQDCVSAYRKQTSVDAELARSVFLYSLVLQALDEPGFQDMRTEAFQICSPLLDIEGRQKLAKPTNLQDFDKLVPLGAYDWGVSPK